MSDEPQKPSDVQYSFDLRSRAITRSDPHSKAVKRIRSTDRLLLTAQNSIEEDADENTMASAAPERQVHVSTGGEMHTAHEGPQARFNNEMLHDQIQRLQSELRFAQAENQRNGGQKSTARREQENNRFYNSTKAVSRKHE
jgi:hypothetical protein